MMEVGRIEGLLGGGGQGRLLGGSGTELSKRHGDIRRS